MMLQQPHRFALILQLASKTRWRRHDCTFLPATYTDMYYIWQCIINLVFKIIKSTKAVIAMQTCLICSAIMSKSHYLCLNKTRRFISLSAPGTPEIVVGWKGGDGVCWQGIQIAAFALNHKGTITILGITNLKWQPSNVRLTDVHFILHFIYSF